MKRTKRIQKLVMLIPLPDCMLCDISLYMDIPDVHKAYG